MFPERFPERMRTDPKRSSERRVYESLAEGLDNDYSVFASVAWISRRCADRALDGEADFVVAHPDLGILVLEVKGGAISRNGATGEWSSRDRDGVSHSIPDPFLQASNNKHKLKRKLRELPGWADRLPSLGHGVVFPSAARLPGDLGPDAPADIVLCFPDMNRLGQRVPEIFAFWRGKDSGWVVPERSGVERLRKWLAKSFDLRTPLGVSVEEDSRSILELDESQYELLDLMDRRRRVLVNGGPGTGKTLLALEKAKRLAKAGSETLLTCYNRLLADYLAASAGRTCGLTVESLYGLFLRLAKESGAQVVLPEPEDLRNDFYRKRLPELLFEALVNRPTCFDAIVVDEGQDSCLADRTVLELMLADGGNGALYVFQDHSQLVYRDSTPWPEADFETFTLTVNRRNTQAIHEVVRRLGSMNVTRAAGPAGVSPEFIEAVGPRQEIDALSRALHRLIREENIAPSRIAVLATTRSVIPEIAPYRRIGAFQITDLLDPAPQQVLFESVSRFKGLERDVVVLVGLREVDYCHFESLLRAGASRARAHLVVIGAPEVVSRFRGV